MKNEYIEEKDHFKIKCSNSDDWFLVDKDIFYKLPDVSYYIDRGFINFRFKNKMYKLHRFVLNINTRNTILKHIDGNKLNNLSSNIKITDLRGPNTQAKKINENNTTGYKGVYKTKAGKYRTIIAFRYKQICFGTFNTPEEAAEAYDKAAIELHGEFARTNKMLGLL